MSGAGDGLLGYSNLRIDQTYMALSCFVYIDTGGYPEMEILIEKDAKPCKTIRFWGSDMAGVRSQSQKSIEGARNIFAPHNLHLPWCHIDPYCT